MPYTHKIMTECRLLFLHSLQSFTECQDVYMVALLPHTLAGHCRTDSLLLASVMYTQRLEGQ